MRTFGTPSRYDGKQTMEAWRRTFCISLIFPHHSIEPESFHSAILERGMAEGLPSSVSPTRTNRALTPVDVSRSAAATNSATPLFHSKRDGSMTIGTPEGCG